MKGYEEGRMVLEWFGQEGSICKQRQTTWTRPRNSGSRLTRALECLLFVDSPAELLGP